MLSSATNREDESLLLPTGHHHHRKRHKKFFDFTFAGRPLTSLHLRSILTVGGLVFLVSSLLELNLRTDSDLSRYQSQTQNDNGRPIGHSFTPAVGPDETVRLVATRTIAKDNSGLRKMDRLSHSQEKLGQHEAILATLVESLIRESHSGLVDLIPSEGYFLDAGMQFGEFGVHLAVKAPERKVMMLVLDPSPGIVKTVKEKKYGALKNLVILQGGLGENVGTMKARDESFEEFPLYTLDSLFFEQGKKLAFAHLDGLELDVLKGAIQTIRKSKPIFTMEIRVHKDVAYTDALMDFISDLGYDTYVINEVCGFHHMDYSNLLNVPRSISVELMHSDAFNILECVESINLIVGM